MDGQGGWTVSVEKYFRCGSFFGQNYPSSQHILRKSLWNPTTNYNWKSDSQINAEQMLVQNETTKSEIKKKNWEEGTNESKH